MSGFLLFYCFKNATNGTFYPYLSVLPVSEFDLKCFDLKMSFWVTIVVLLEEGGEGMVVVYGGYNLLEVLKHDFK